MYMAFHGVIKLDSNFNLCAYQTSSLSTAVRMEFSWILGISD